MLVVGQGTVMVEGNKALAAMAEITVSFGAESQSIPTGDTAGEITLGTAQPITGAFRFRSANASVLAILTGGTALDSDGTGNTAIRYIRETIALSNAATVVTGTLTEDATKVEGNTYIRVVPRGSQPHKVLSVGSAPSNALEVDWVVADPDGLKFSADAFADGTLCDVAYFYAETAGATRIFRPDPEALPPTLHFVFGMKLYDEYLATAGAGGLVGSLKKVTRTGDLGSIGAAVTEVGSFGFEWRADLLTTGDIEMYWVPDGLD